MTKQATNTQMAWRWADSFGSHPEVEVHTFLEAQQINKEMASRNSSARLLPVNAEMDKVFTCIYCDVFGMHASNPYNLSTVVA